MTGRSRNHSGMANVQMSTKSKFYCFNCGATNHDEEDCPNGQKEEMPEVSSSSSGVSSSAATARVLQESMKVERTVPDSPSAQSSEPLFRLPGRKQKVLKPSSPEQLAQLYPPGEGTRNPVGENFGNYKNDTVKVFPESFRGLKKNSFDDFGLLPEILEKVKNKFDTPLPIQQYAASIIESGSNLKASARTGCGKTAAFLLPIINNIAQTDVRVSKELPQAPKALIIAPTRELAQQIYTDAQSFAALTQLNIRLCHGHAFINSETQKLASGTNILIGTLGRTVDHLRRENIVLDDLRYLVFDEADRLLNEDFAESINDLMRFIENCRDKPQTLLFSATFPDRIMNKIDSLITDHVSLQVGILGTVSDDVEQSVELVREEDKRGRLLEILKAEPSRDLKTFVFVRSKERAGTLYDHLRRNKVLCVVMHADRDQFERNKALREFNDGLRNVMVSTWIGSRGLDVHSVNRVIMYDLPDSIEQYINCLGRTGRVGNKGEATSFFDPDYADDRAIANELKIKMTESGEEVPDFLNI